VVSQKNTFVVFGHRDSNKTFEKVLRRSLLFSEYFISIPSRKTFAVKSFEIMNENNNISQFFAIKLHKTGF
jgi:hypothetical protein